ncbi:MAG: 23S rRNA (uracil(1939)-C(5))-methyltransferase RlmD [Candidatus Gastranaerophilales bacterium]|nr:23S rRNA (uracil(1939)-C(5))-methyltransferase RlmD [Candidatus Gastranaerophilales bacterium]
MKVNDEYTLIVEKMINGGTGLARINDFPVFIDSSCPEDKLKVRISRVCKNYAEAEIIEIINPSKSRVTPICAMHNVCGSCGWQHIEYSEQLKQKQNIVKETIKNIAGLNADVLPVIPSPKINEYRCKVQYPVSQTKVSKRLLSGYYQKNSHELINIKFCPMNPRIISEINEYIKQIAQNFSISGYDEKQHKGLLKHIIYRISSDLNQIIIVFVINSKKTPQNLKELAEQLIVKYKDITGICANYNTDKTNVITGKHTELIIGKDFYIETMQNIKYKITAGSFFQVNPYCAEKIFNTVKKIISEKVNNPSILDAYSGVSSFGIWLSSIARKAVSIEESKSASIDAQQNKELNNIKNIEIINGDAAKEFKKLIERKEKFDVCLIDPPRKGATIEALDYLTALSKKYIVYVSCNPSTLARDLKYLIEHKYKLIYVQPADMFPNTPHIETIVMLEKITAI